MSDNSKAPAFPTRAGHFIYIPESARETVEAALEGIQQNSDGLTKRELLTAIMAAGLLSGGGWSGDLPNLLATQAMKIADAILEQANA